MIDGKTLAKAVLWHQVKVWSIPVILWLGSAYYLASHRMPEIAEVILWSPLLLVVLFDSPTTLSTPRLDADRDFKRIIDEIKMRDANKYTFILNYFVNHNLTTEIKECTIEEGLNRIRELRSSGSEIKRENYGFYKITRNKIDEIYKEAA